MYRLKTNTSYVEKTIKTGQDEQKKIRALTVFPHKIPIKPLFFGQKKHRLFLCFLDKISTAVMKIPVKVNSPFSINRSDSMSKF